MVNVTWRGRKILQYVPPARVHGAQERNGPEIEPVRTMGERTRSQTICGFLKTMKK